MQNTPQTFRGSAAPGVNYSEHSYDNHLGGHCPPGGYQPYSNQLYHPRPHHYGNHQMQQNMPYRHHGGGAYAPNQNQYGSNMNQDMYRNHHPGYAGNNTRNIPQKTWTENNNSSDLMPPYGQVSPHSQMMNNPSQMPVNAMRSPPHAASNMNPSPQGQQHFRPMQSPGHSPHSWSQAQIPSPGMMHSRTSPLPAHVRSPGHSQPFSPPSAHSMNLQPHLPPQENGQIPQPMSVTGGGDNLNPGNPLHSLQKMVLLDQDPSGMMALPGDASEQFPNQCGPPNYGPEECKPPIDPKDSQYSTYYNMDENRFESKPNSNDSSAYAPVQQVTNCNYPIPSHPGSNESDVKSVARISNVNPNIAETYHANPNQNSIPPPQMISAVEQLQCKSNIPQNDCSLKQNECPPLAESAPVFTDQTKAAVSTNSEQALESKSNNNWISDTCDPEKASVAQVCNADSAGTPHSSTHQSPNHPVHENSVNELDDSAVNNKPLSKDHDSYTLKDSESNSEKLQDAANPSIGTPSSESQDCDSNITSTDSKSSIYEDSQGSEKKVALRRCRTAVSYEEAPSPETENKVNAHCDSWNLENKSSSNQKEAESNSPIRNPVKVVIHRIRKSDADDTWHVPGNTLTVEEVESQNENKVDNVSETKKSSAPQIIMLSPAVSDRRPQNSSSSNSVVSIEDNQTVDNDISSPITVKKEPTSSPEKSSSSLSADKKRPGRPVGSRNKMKQNSIAKTKRGKKGGKKRKNDNSKQKIPDPVTKIKKINKTFGGPFVRLTGSKENPSSISVVNVAQKEEEKLSKTQTKRNVSTAVNRIKSKTVGHLSTLSPTYDAYNRDKTWVCVFCQKGSHHGGLGDLYGPYYIKYTADEKPIPSSNPGTSAARNKRKKSETDESKTPKRAKQSPAPSTPAASRPVKTAEATVKTAEATGKTAEATEDTAEPMKEVWIHEDCAVWCQSITLIGEEVRGLDEAVTEANENKCCQCAFHGATLGCWGKGCKEMYHYTCAKAIGCQLDIEKFSLLCLKHEKKSPENPNRCQ